MIYEALSCITEEINNSLKRKLQINEDKVILCGLVNQDGSSAIQGENKVIITLINVEKEAAGMGAAKNNAGVFTATAAPVSINLYVLCAAYFSGNNYAEALRFLSFTIAFFQSKSIFSVQNTPSLDPGINKLAFEMESPGPDRLNSMWTTLGAKYMPSVLYKVRMLTFDDSIIKEYRPPIVGTVGNALPA
ncbi:uncharacterized protein DUF4255 [Chitinophaga niastensis]|uniref:Uncharacterized protein DUF4255 n=1 Tax=Chitinophaga niastensis TaxID=536980 RepID=A0A2P8HGM7_CHINA|nr:DUF4255 domain-containing protein [Chitinophaga niastensis]PSL45369.1 uncharacterized protein DUF4255 [Chitinophaga niastensis]